VLIQLEELWVTQTKHHLSATLGGHYANGANTQLVDPTLFRKDHTVITANGGQVEMLPSALFSWRIQDFAVGVEIVDEFADTNDCHAVMMLVS
jgi:hypothetical protein